MALRLSRRDCLTGTACLALGAGLSACSAPQPALRVGAIRFAGYEFLFLAEAMGWLRAAPIRLVEMHANTDVLHALALGRLEAAALTLDEVLTGLSDGIPLKVLAVLDLSAGADVVMARAPLTEPAALKGQRIGVEDSAVGAVMLAAVLEAGGLLPTDVQKVNMPLPSSVDVFRSGQVDAVVTAEPWASTLRAQGAVAVFDSRAIPGRIVDVLAVREEALGSHVECLHALVKGHFRAVGHYRQNPADAATRMAARMGVAVDEVPNAFQGLELPDEEANRALLAQGGRVRRNLPGLMQVLRAQGLLARDVPAGDPFDLRWLQHP